MGNSKEKYNNGDHTDKQKRAKKETSYAKVAGFEVPTDSIPLTREALAQRYPEAVRFEGTFREVGEPTGIIGINIKGDIVFTAFHPNRILQDPTSNSGQTGGERTMAHTEPYMLRRYGKEKAADMARQALISLCNGKMVNLYGDEDEGLLIDPRLAQIAVAESADQDELHRGLLEEALDPQPTIEAAMLHRAIRKRTLQKRMEKKGLIHVNTSTPWVGSYHREHGDDGLKRNNGKLENYVTVISNKMLKVLGFFDAEATQLADSIAQDAGYKNAQEAINVTGDITILFFIAKHFNNGVVHFREKNGKSEVVSFKKKGRRYIESPTKDKNNTVGKKAKLVVPTEIAIAHANLATATSGVISTWLNFNSPIILGRPIVLEVEGTDGKPVLVWAKDGRSVIRHLSATSLPGEPIKDADDLTERIVAVVKTGDAVADRSAFIATLPDDYKSQKLAKESIPSSHGPTRLRASTDKPMVRIEYTDMPAGPSPLDEYAANCLAEIDMYAALLAVSKGKTVEEFYGREFPSLTRSSDRLEMEKAFNYFGMEDERVKRLIDEKLRHLSFMEEEFPHLKNHIAVARARIKNLLIPTTARNFTQLYENGHQGHVPEVVKNMWTDGATAMEITLAAMDYQTRTFADLEKANGDAALVLGLKHAA